MADIHHQWKALIERNPSSGEILHFCTSLVKEYWRIVDEPMNKEALDKLYLYVMKENRTGFIGGCMEFVLDETGIQLEYPAWLK